MNPASQAPRPASLRRFSLAERAVHWAVAVLMIACILTAAALYNGPLGIAVGHRHLVELIHVYSGFALPVPTVLGLASLAYRADLRSLNRLTQSDRQWLRSRNRHDGFIEVGKFNAGQKLNAALSGGAILVLLGTGVIMFLPDLTRLSWRSGATFVHDWFALALGLLVIGHVVFALRDPEARRGMRTGVVSTHWALAEHRAWVDEQAAQPEADPTAT
ncbi:MAG: cytochrome b/b6 domain-containing protein [Sciscionella sp.]